MLAAGCGMLAPQSCMLLLPAGCGTLVLHSRGSCVSRDDWKCPMNSYRQHCSTPRRQVPIRMRLGLRAAWVGLMLHIVRSSGGSIARLEALLLQDV